MAFVEDQEFMFKENEDNLVGFEECELPITEKPN
jgi:hypothetical protein